MKAKIEWESLKKEEEIIEIKSINDLIDIMKKEKYDIVLSLRFCDESDLRIIIYDDYLE